jgi:hypothetical protein
MKKIILLFLFFFGILSFAQNTEKGRMQYLKITQKECAKKKGYQLVLKKVLSDSRCPEGVTCVWAGETKVVISVYKDGKLIEDKAITNPTGQNQEDQSWFSNYLPSNKRNIKSISVFPYPKEGRVIKPKDYYIKFGYVK